MRGAPRASGPDMPLSTPPWPASTTTVYLPAGAPERPAAAGLDEAVGRGAEVGGPLRAPGPRMVGRTVVSDDRGSFGMADSGPRCGGSLLGAAGGDSGGVAAASTRAGTCS